MKLLLLKKPPKALLDNYRPITLTSCLSKVYAKILERRLSGVLEQTNLLGDGQQGFRSNRGCQDNILLNFGYFR